jgi:transcription-repair coupling factor (superfamily II helicase)
MSLAIIKSEIAKLLDHNSLNNKLLSGGSIALKGLSGSLKAIVISIIFKKFGNSFLIVFPDREEAETVTDELTDLLGEQKVAFFPGSEIDEVGPASLNPRKTGLQMQVIRGLLSKTLKIVITSADGVVTKFPVFKKILEACIKLEVGLNYDLYDLVEKLISFGYTRESIVERSGEISLRGGILDIFPYTGEDPCRIEFFGNKIESIRIFDINTQRSIGIGTVLHLVPSLSDWDDCSESILNYFPDKPFIYLEDPDLILGEIQKEHQRGKKEILASEEFKALYKKHKVIFHYTLSSSKEVIDFGGRSVLPLSRSPKDIREILTSIAEQYQKAYLFCQQSDQIARIKNYLELDEYPINKLSLNIGPIRRGFFISSIGIAVYTMANIFNRDYRFRRKPRFKQGVPLRELSSIEHGDFVVHIDHGIGQYLGLEKIYVKDIERECLAIQYKNEDKLYVPVDKMERVQKYTGKEGSRPELHKLGGKGWENLKARTKEAILDIARDLITIYSTRKALPGFAFSSDTTWQNELEATFTYEETPDQEKTINEVKSDMEQSKPMDRLICGDVGYGKTEIAVRAAFKAVNDGKQVVILTPTTILAQQHFRTFKQRLSYFPILIEVLSRFRTKKEQKIIIDGLKQGRVDIVIGTHRLLSKDIKFKDIGLLIIDEEQRFGVQHKEKLKALRKTVDVLALSATPIPRTLSLSMMGIRDISLINTPPKDRLPIITEVLPFNKLVLAEAIHRELARGGQIFFVHNRIQSIYKVADMINKIVPEIRLAVAHGKMHENDLERVMLEFIDDKYDCLVATMIIGAGLDMPNVNTLLVNRADRLGLAQLYQLRGRVGRSNQRAYAYLFTPPFRLLTEEAIKRLRTIEEFTELGSGFQIALRDLEIRGAGNILGVQQSGKINAVGIDLYMKLIEEAVQELNTEKSEKNKIQKPFIECRIDLDVSAYFPEIYISDENIRVNLYRRLSSFKKLSEIDVFYQEIKDRFGFPPEEADNLLESARLRIIGQNQGLKRIFLEDKVLKIFFDEDWIDHFLTQEKFSEYVKLIIHNSQASVRFLQERGFGLRIEIPGKKRVEFTKKLLQSWG